MSGIEPVPPGATAFSLDSNIFIYAYLGQDARKRERSLDLIAQAQATRQKVALQVMGEVFQRLRRPDGIDPASAARLVTQEFAFFRPVAADTEVFRAAMALSAQTGRQFWDSLIVACCAAHGVTRLYTEDLGPAPAYVLGVELVNPYLDLEPA